MNNGKTTSIEARRFTLEGLTLSQKQFANLKEQILKLIPWTFIKKGSVLWWDKSEAESRRAYQDKKYTVLKTKKDVERFVHSV